MIGGIGLVEVGPRDGLQNEARTLDPGTRAELITRLVEHGARRMEAVSFVRPDKVPQMSGAEEVMARVPQREDVSYIGLVLNRRGAERAVESAVQEINIVVPVTDEFSTRNQGTTAEQMLDQAGMATEVAHAAGLSVSVTLAVAFGCPFSGEVPLSRVKQVVARVSAMGVDELAFADTIGVGTPSQVRAFADLARADFSNQTLRFHFHNTRNTGYANALTAAAVTGFVGVALDASVGGFGGCPFAPKATGNIATEDLLYALGREHLADASGMQGLIEDATWLSGLLASPIQSLMPHSGPFPPDPASGGHQVA